mgnify:CR=1 FL=1
MRSFFTWKAKNELKFYRTFHMEQFWAKIILRQSFFSVWKVILLKLSQTSDLRASFNFPKRSVTAILRKLYVHNRNRQRNLYLDTLCICQIKGGLNFVPFLPDIYFDKPSHCFLFQRNKAKLSPFYRLFCRTGNFRQNRQPNGPHETIIFIRFVPKLIYIDFFIAPYRF